MPRIRARRTTTMTALRVPTPPNRTSTAPAVGMTTATTMITITITATRIPTRMTIRDGASLLLIWLSPAFPVGAFAYSHGLEWAVESGDIADGASLQGWLADLVAHGSPRNDLILAAHARRAAQAQDANGLADLNALALALCASRERLLETQAQGRAFLTAVRAAWPHPALDVTRAFDGGDVAYPIAYGAACAAHGVDADFALEAFLTACVGNLVSAGLRLGVIGQTEGQRILAALLPQARAQARATLDAPLSALGGAALRSDLAALHHETQYSRLFRS